jgi:hypothetical protein
MNPETSADVDTSKMNHGELFQHIWNTEIVPTYNEKSKLDAERRVDAFAETTITVCGEEIRMMTARDLFVLDACENPLVAGGLPVEEDCARFIWQLHPSNDGTHGFFNRFRRGRIFQRITTRPDVAQTVAEIEEYVDRMLLETPEDEEDRKKRLEADGENKPAKKPANTHFISPLLMNVAADIGHCDPMTGALLGDTPLPRLLQYARDIRKMKGADSERENRFIDTLQMKCMDKVNAMVAARNVKPQTDA